MRWCWGNCNPSVVEFIWMMWVKLVGFISQQNIIKCKLWAYFLERTVLSSLHTTQSMSTENMLSSSLLKSVVFISCSEQCLYTKYAIILTLNVRNHGTQWFYIWWDILNNSGPLLWLEFPAVCCVCAFCCLTVTWSRLLIYMVYVWYFCDG